MTLSKLIQELSKRLEIYGDIPEVRVRHSSGFASVEVLGAGVVTEGTVIYLKSSDEHEAEVCEFCGEKGCPA